MTEKEIQDQHSQAMQDGINLDYGKWSAQQRSAKLPNDHELWQQ